MGHEWGNHSIIGVVNIRYTPIYGSIAPFFPTWMLLHALTVARLPRQAGSSRIRFRPVAAYLTPIAMADMIARYRSALDRHLADPLVLVPLTVQELFTIEWQLL